MGDLKIQRVKIIMKDGSFAYCDIKVHDIFDQHKKHESLRILKEMKSSELIITESGPINTQFIQKVELVNDKEGKIGF